MDQLSPIAIIGVAFRLPGGVNSLESLEKLLNSGGSGFGPVPDDRWNRDAFYSTQQNAKCGMPVKEGYFLHDDVSEFDARFFSISRQEAATMDPKQRILLQTTYEALENAGIPLERLRGSKTSVYVSTFTYDFERMGFRDTQVLSGLHTTSVGPAILSNRLSHFFDLRGPSFTLDTGCSGGLVALHQACQSLRHGESNMAIVGGAQLLLDPDQSSNMSTIGMLSADGRCYAFDSRGSGYGRGEGIATLILKRLDQALADGDPIQTVIINSGLNQDGRSAGSIMSPSGDAQAELMRSVYAEVGLDPAETIYVEAHGTGTKVGDREEISSISQVFCEGRQGKSNVIVGSIKANIGHLEASAGLAGLVKSIGLLNSGLVPPQINFVQPKSSLHLDKRRISITTELIPLPAGPRRASVNSFGYGGTNSHVIIESPSTFLKRASRPTASLSSCDRRVHGDILESTTNGSNFSSLTNGSNQTSGHSNGSTKKTCQQLFVLSANSEKSLKLYSQNLRDWVRRREPSSKMLANLSYTLLNRRSFLPWRSSITASSFDDLSTKLGSIQTVKAAPLTRLAFVFTGQGAQWAGMGRELMSYPVFERSILMSENLLLEMGCQWLLSEEMFADDKSSRLGEAELAQPATTGLQIALVDLLDSFDVIPSSVVGHSSGEIGAAYAAGALTHQAAIEIAYRRGVYSGQAKRRNTAPGSMLAVGLNEIDVLPYLENIKNGRLCVACVNSPQSTTISGDIGAIEELKQSLDVKSIFARKLKVDTAYHSHHMETIANDYLGSLRNVKTGNARSDTLFCSTVIGSSKREDFGSDYWVQNLVSKVRFADGLRVVSENAKADSTGVDYQSIFVEIGPTAALAGPAKQTMSSIGFKHAYLSALKRNTDASESLLSLLGHLAELGHHPDMASVSEASSRVISHDLDVLTDLPGYPFEKSSHWAESRLSAAHRFRRFPHNDLCGILDPASTTYEPRWRQVLDLDALPWLKDHIIDGNAVFPASGYVTMAVEAMKQLLVLQQTQGTPNKFLLRDVTLLQVIAFSLEEQDSSVETQLTIIPSKVGLRWKEFKLFSFDKANGRWYENCTGLIAAEVMTTSDGVEGESEDQLSIEVQLAELKSIQGQSEDHISRETFYEQLKAHGNHYGETFSLVNDIKLGQDQGVATLVVPDYSKLMPGHQMQPHLIHPTLLDSFSHIGAALAQSTCSDASIVVGKIHEMTLTSDFTATVGTDLHLATTQHRQDRRTVRSKSIVFQQNGKGALVPTMTASYTFRAFSSTTCTNEEGAFSQKKVYSIVLQPDVDFGTPDSFQLATVSGVETRMKRVVDYMSLCAFKYPKMKVLDASSSIESVTLPLLSSLRDKDSDVSLDCYDVAGSSKESNPDMSHSFAPWLNQVSFKPLRITKDLLPEDLDTKYDVVIMRDIFEDPQTVDVVLQNARRLLRESGRLLVYLTDFSHSIDKVNDLFNRHGFSRVGKKPENSMENSLVSSLLVANPVLTTPTKCLLSCSAKIISGYDAPVSKDVALELTVAASQFGNQLTLSETSLQEITPSPQETYIVLDTAENTLLLNETPQIFEGLKRILTVGAKVIWISLQESPSHVADSKRSMIQGAARVIRRENGDAASLTVFEIEDHITTENIKDICVSIFKIVERALHTLPSIQHEHEYVYRCGQVMIPRLKMDHHFLRGVGSSADGGDKLVTSSYHNVNRPLKLDVEIPGLLNSLRFVDDPMVVELQPWEIQVTSKAHGINFKDVFIALGQMPASVNMVGEVSGVVTSVGQEMKERYSIGDHVMGFFAKPFASSPRLNGNLAHKMPEDMSFDVAATIPCIYTTAYHCLFEIGRFRKGQSVLITAASGGVGQAAIQLAQHAGASEIFVTLGSKSKKDLIMNSYGIPESHIFSSRKLDFKHGVLRLTRGRGVDIVVNSLTGDMLTEAFDCVAKLGTFCEIGKGDIYKGSHIALGNFDRSITFAAIDLVAVAEQRPTIVYEHLQAIVGMFKRSQLHPLKPITTYPIGETEDAFRLIAGRKHTGKIVLISGEEAVVKATLPQPTRLSLPSNGAYVIAGGLGDLGKRITALLASRGAQHIVLLSRRTLQAKAKEALKSIVYPFETKLHILKCDIISESDVNQCADHCKRNALIVKGVIHSGMVLRDRPFYNMTRGDFAVPLGPKVYGTLNLDKAFASSELDFFIMLSSSATIIGNGSQANYAAANAFQDAFARSHLGNPHTSYVALNLGAVEGSEAVAAISEAQSSRLKSISISMEELLLGIEYAMTSQARQDRLVHAVMGISRQGFVDADDLTSLANPIFSHLPVTEAESVVTNKASTDVRQLIQNRTLNEAQGLITESLTAKCASFLDRPMEEVPLDQPLSNIGFDSLVSIELKNWILRTFDSPVQTADISGAASIAALAETVRKRSRLIDTQGLKGTKVEEAEVDSIAKPADVGLENFKCCVATTPPRLPLSSLDDYLDAYWRTVAGFARDDSEKESLRKTIDEFRAPGSLGVRMYAALEERAKDPNTQCWLANPQVNSSFLHFRHPLAPWQAFMHTHHDSPRPHTQAERAAILTTVAFKFLKGMEGNQIGNDWLGPRPLCSYYWTWMFNAVREPHVHCDEMKIFAESRHVAVLYKGYLFKVPLHSEPGDISLEQFQSMFQSILDTKLGEGCWASVLTTDFRDPWAKNREMLIGLSNANRDYFKTIEEATFVICLDQSSPNTNEERVAQGIVGEGFNRWFDKTTQFVVYANGRSAHISEHTMIDGTTPLRLTEFVHDMIMSHKSTKLKETISTRLPEQFHLQTTPDIDEYIQQVRRRYSDRTSTQGYRYIKTSTINHSLAAGTGLSSKACLDFTLQLAARLHFGYSPASWEPVSVQHFHRGRPDPRQSVDSSVVAFCDAAIDENVSICEKKRLLIKAAKEWEAQTKSVQEGSGFLRRTEALLGVLAELVPLKQRAEAPTLTEEQMLNWTWAQSLASIVPDGIKLPKVFTNEVFNRVYPGNFELVRNEGEFVDAAGYLMGENSIWISNRVRENYVALSVIGDADKVGLYEECFHRAANLARTIITAE